MGHVFNSNVGNEFRVMLRRKGAHKQESAHDIVRIHSVMIYTDLIEYTIVGNTEAFLLRCFLFLSQLKAGKNITTAEHMNYQTKNMNYQTFSSSQFGPLLKNFFHTIQNYFRDTSGKKTPLISGTTCLVLMFRKTSNNHF